MMSDIYAEFKALQKLHYEDDIDLHYYEDAVDLAHRANKLGLKQVVVTNRAHEGRGNASPHSIIGRSKINELISEIRCRDQVEFPKPDLRAIHDWFDSQKINPENVLVVGDQYIDAQLAINFGGRAVLVTRNGVIPRLEELGPDIQDKVFLVKSLHDVELK